jgi:dihydroxyacetone kinase
LSDPNASEKSTFEDRMRSRRGIAGTILLHKILGAASEIGWNITQVLSLGNRVSKGKMNAQIGANF